MTTKLGTRLTLDHRAQLLALRATTIRDLVSLWPLWDVSRAPTWRDFRRVATTLVQTRQRQAAGLAVAYYRRFRLAENVGGRATPVLAPALPAEQVETSLESTGLASTYRALGAGFTIEGARRQGFVAVAGAAGRLVLQGSRQTIKLSTDRDPKSNTWARVTSDGACTFCEMLADRGPVYSETGVDFESHDHCACFAEPYFGGAPTRTAPAQPEEVAPSVASLAEREGVAPTPTIDLAQALRESAPTRVAEGARVASTPAPREIPEGFKFKPDSWIDEAGDTRAEIKSAERAQADAVRSMYEGDFAGLRTEVDARPNLARGVIRNADGREVGRFTRFLEERPDGSIVADHHFLELEPAYQGNGFAAAFNARAEEQYRALGVSRIELTANIDVGGYAWAMQGYEWNVARMDSSAFVDMLLRQASRAARLEFEGSDASIQTEIAELRARLESGDVPTPREIAMLGKSQTWESEGRTTWIGKQTMMHQHWLGVKELA